MLLTDLFDLLIPEHPSRLGDLVLIVSPSSSCALLTVSSRTTCLLGVLLLDLESGLACPVLGERLARSVALGAQSPSRSLVRLGHLVLVPVGKGLLPLLGVLFASEATYAGRL